MMLPAQDPFLSVGTIFRGGYEILSVLGAGSFGRVYQARQLSTGQAVAIKILRPPPGTDSGEAERIGHRFRNEMKLCGTLIHPNIVRLLDWGDAADGLLYAVFEFVPGATLREVLAQEGRLRVAEAAHLMAQVLDALSCAHREGIVHRDLKPENIMITQTGARRNAMVLDFGLGGFVHAIDDGERRTGAGEIIGTPCYAAPEQLRGEAPAPRSDLYSWGLVLLECLTGQVAVGGDSPREVIATQLRPEPVVLPSWLRDHPLGRVLEMVTAKAVEQRAVSIDGLLEALADGAQPGAESPPSSSVRIERRQLTVVACRLTVVGTADGAIDIEDLDEVLRAHHEACAQIAARAAGCVAGTMADRVLFVFGYPQARENDARRAVGAALDMISGAARSRDRLERERQLRVHVRIGVHTGIASVRARPRTSGPELDQFVGLTAHLAAALADRAAAGEILVSTDAQRLLRDEFVTEAVDELCMTEPVRRIGVVRVRGSDQGRREQRARRETPLIGRQRALAELVNQWERANAGQPTVVLVRGEPGIGKSRLVRELRRLVPSERWIGSWCSAENQSSPLRPVADLLGAFDEPLEDVLRRYRFRLAETVPLFAPLMGWPAEQYAPLPLSPDRQKELTLEALLVLLRRMAETAPLVFALEDIHWADATTLELLALLAREPAVGAPAEGGGLPRLCAVFTARPEFVPPWTTAGVRLIELARLDEREVAEMISAGLSAGAAVPAAVVNEVVRRADGIPLFVEEVTRVLFDNESSASGAVVPAPADGGAFQIPATLRDLLTARLDALSAGGRETAQRAAVLGREFRYELLQAVAGQDAARLRADLAELQVAGLVFHRRAARNESYVFKHALVRDAVYESLTKATRADLHRQVATTMQQRFPEIVRQRPEILAYHFERGGQIENAMDYLHRAGGVALHRAAYQDAYGLLEHGLVLARSAPDSPANRRREIELRSSLGTVQISTRGYAAAEVEETFRAAWERCETLGGDIPTHVLFGIWAVNITRSDRAGVDAMLPRLRRIVEESDDPVALLAACGGLGCCAYWVGDLPMSEHYLARGRQLFNTDEFRRFSQTYGYGAGLYCYAFGMLTLWLLGYPDRADAVRRDLFTIAELSRDPYVTCVAIGLAMTLAHDLDEPEEEMALADRVMAIAIEQHMPLWQAAGALGRGGALLRRGHSEDALPLIRAGIEGFRAIGVMCSYSYFLQYLADAYLRAGHVQEALAVIGDAVSLCETLVARPHEPEMLRLHAEVLLLSEDVAGAEAYLRRALELARQRCARAQELRVATSLGQLLRARGRTDEARAILSGVYGWFTEGLESPDLRAARAVLLELDGDRPA